MRNNMINKQNDIIDIAKIFKKYTKHWYLFALSFMVCIGVMFFYIKIKKPVYQINANILIKSDNSKTGSIQSAMMKNFSLGGLIGGSSDVLDELEIVNSFTIIRQTIKKLDLNKEYSIDKFIQKKECYLNSPLEILAEDNIADTLSVVLTFKVNSSKDGKTDVSVYKGFKSVAKLHDMSFPINVSTPYGKYTIVETSYHIKGEPLKMTINFLGYDWAAEKLKKEIKSDLVSKKSNIINIGIEETHKKRGKEILDTMIMLYNKSGINEKNILAESTAKFLDERINVVSKDLAAIEYEVELYKKTNNLTDIEEEAKIMLEKNGDFKEKLIMSETQYSVITLIENFLLLPLNKFNLVPLNLGISDKSIAEGLQNYNALLLERLKLMRSTTQENPAIEAINEKVEVVRNNVLSTIQSIKSGIGISIKDLRKQEDSFINRIKNMPTQEREFINIKRQQMIKQELFVFLLQRKEENALNISVTTPKAQIVDKAYILNKPLEPKLPIVLLVTLFASLLIPVLYLQLKELLNTKLTSRKELEKLTNVPILGKICKNTTPDEILIMHNRKASYLVESFRLIRINLQLKLESQKDKVVLITSSINGEGKTFFSTNLALSLASLNKKVILLELDFRNPGLDTIFPLNKSKLGLTDFLASDDCTYDSIIFKSKLDSSLDIIYSGTPSMTSPEQLMSEKLDQLVDHLRREYDYIIIDSAPVALVSDTYTLNRIIDTTIYVCRINYVNKREICDINNLIATNKLKNVSLLINEAEN